MSDWHFMNMKDPFLFTLHHENHNYYEGILSTKQQHLGDFIFIFKCNKCLNIVLSILLYKEEERCWGQRHVIVGSFSTLESGPRIRSKKKTVGN